MEASPPGGEADCYAAGLLVADAGLDLDRKLRAGREPVSCGVLLGQADHVGLRLGSDHEGAVWGRVDLVTLDYLCPVFLLTLQRLPLPAVHGDGAILPHRGPVVTVWWRRFLSSRASGGSSGRSARMSGA